MPTFLSGAVKLASATLLVVLVMAPAVTQAVDEVDKVDDTVYVPSPKYDWNTRVNQATVAESDTITLVVHSARDCSFCARWKGPLGGEGRFRSWSSAHPGTRLVIVERAAISSSETPGDYPQDLKWLSDQYQKDNRLRPGTPTFEVFVAQNLVFRSYGLHSWDEKAFPAVKDLDSRRLRSGENAK